MMSIERRIEILIEQSLKVLRENTGAESRYKRERIYEMVRCMPEGEHAESYLRNEMGDTDDNRDTRDGDA